MGMTEMASAPTRGKKRMKLVIVLISVMLVVLGSIFWVAWLVVSALQPQELSVTLTGETATTVKENTAELCAEIECVEGWETGVGNYLDFATNDMAEYWSIVIGGDSFRNGKIILDMNGLDLSIADRRLAVEILFPGRDWNVVPWLGLK